MTHSLIYCNTACTICNRELAIKVADFPFNDHRRPAYTALYTCIGCGSGFFHHAPREGSTLAWHQKVYERNIEWSKLLYEKLVKVHRVSSVIDIGCGIGTWLSYLDSRGTACLGFDTSKVCIDYGVKTYGLNLLNELFTAKHEVAVNHNADLLTCIMVMEHLTDPKVLAAEIGEYCRATGAWAFVCVPYFNDKKYLIFDSESSEYNLFNDVGAHVTYFSDLGMKIMFEGVGLEFAHTVGGGAWRGHLFKPFGSATDAHHA